MNSESSSAESAAPLRKRFFQCRDPWGHGVALWVLAAMLFVAPLAVSSLRHVRLDNEVENWLPENDPSALEYLWCRQHFPEEEKVILTWEGSTPDDLRLPVLVGQLAGKVDEDGIRRGGLPYVKSVIHAGDVINKMVEFGVDPADAIHRVEGTFVGYGPIKVRLTDAGRQQSERTRRAIQEVIKQRYGITLRIHDAARSWEPPRKREPQFDALFERFRPPAVGNPEATRVELGEHDLQISWPGMSTHPETRDAVMATIREFKSFATSDSPHGQRLVEKCYRVLGSPIAVVITLSDAGVSQKSQAIAEIRQTAIDSFIPDEGLIVGGRVVAAAELNNGVIRAAFNPAATSWLEKSVIGLSGLVGIIFALISLKSVRIGILVIGVSYYSALLGVSLIPLSGGTMNMVLVVMPTLLMVLALSGAIHIANYWKHAVWENPDTAVVEATRMASQPCLMAAFTTSLGLMSLIKSDLVPVREFGIYASIGTLISVAMVLYGLPSLLQMVPLRRVAPEEVNPVGWTRFSDLISRRWLQVGTLILLVAGFCTYGLTRFDVETKVIRYFPESSQVVKDYTTIEDNLAGISPVEVLIRFDEQSQDQIRFIERMELVRQIEQEIRQHSEVSGTLSLASFLPSRDIPEDTASTRTKIIFNRRSNETERRIKEDHIEQTQEFLTMNRIPEENGTELWRISAQAAVLSDADYNLLTQQLSDRVAGITRYHAGVDHVVTGTVPLFLRTQRAVLDSLIESSLLAFALIAAVMIWVLKDPIAGMVSMIPNLLPVVSVFGLVSWFGQKIDIGTMVTASVAMGIAVDGTLHLLTWFRTGLDQGMSREGAIKQALIHCGPAMWQTSAAVGIGLLVLFPAELLLISRFGWLMAMLIAAAFIGDIVLLPCMLVGPLGMLLERRIPKADNTDTASEAASTADIPPTIPAPHIALQKSNTSRRSKRGLKP